MVGLWLAMFPDPDAGYTERSLCENSSWALGTTTSHVTAKRAPSHCRPVWCWLGVLLGAAQPWHPPTGQKGEDKAWSCREGNPAPHPAATCQHLRRLHRCLGTAASPP